MQSCRFESLPLVRPNCGADTRIMAFVTEPAPGGLILAAISSKTPLRYLPTPSR